LFRYLNCNLMSTLFRFFLSFFSFCETFFQRETQMYRTDMLKKQKKPPDHIDQGAIRSAGERKRYEVIIAFSNE
jgi:hypothetical protein